MHIQFILTTAGWNTDDQRQWNRQQIITWTWSFLRTASKIEKFNKGDMLTVC